MTVVSDRKNASGTPVQELEDETDKLQKDYSEGHYQVAGKSWILRCSWRLPFDRFMLRNSFVRKLPRMEQSQG